MKHVIPALIIAAAYLLVWLCSPLSVPDYYLATAVVFGAAAVAFSVLAVKHNSTLLYLYALCNLLSCIFSILITYEDIYYILNGPFWHWPVNISLLSEVVEIMILLKGGRDAVLAISSSNADSNHGNTRSSDSLASIKRVL